MTYGQCENSNVTQAKNLLPMGLAQGCRLKRDILRDQVLTYSDVELPSGRLCDQLRAQQNAHFTSSKLLQLSRLTVLEKMHEVELRYKVEP